MEVGNVVENGNKMEVRIFWKFHGNLPDSATVQLDL